MGKSDVLFHWGGGIKGRVGKIQLAHSFEEIISLENLCLAWQEFIVGKKNKPDVQLFACRLMDNIVSLHEELANKTYRHGGYTSFHITDPKPRHIHKASVRDRLLHHAVYRILYPFFDRVFIPDSYSCRTNKGLHKAINRFRQMACQVSQNRTKTCWVLKCDISKFFASIDHRVLLDILGEYIPDKDIMWLLREAVGSYHTCEQTEILHFARNGNRPIGLPLGNLTSQLFANVYLNVFDRFVKHRLKIRYYIRYADDFVVLSNNKLWLEGLILLIQNFLFEKLKLVLHPNKIFLKTVASGVDFLGWVNFADHRILRGTTKRRMFSRIKTSPQPATLQSYLGLLKHGQTFKTREQLRLRYWLWR